MVDTAQVREEVPRIPFGNRIIRRGVGWVVPVSFGGAFFFLVTVREVLAPIDALLEQCLAVGVALVIAGCIVLPVGMMRAAIEPRRLVDRETKESFTLEFYDRYLIFTLKQWGIGFLVVGVLLSLLEPNPQAF